MLTQLFGPRLMAANATGCSIIWSASFPSIPRTRNSRGQGPTWANSLFEDSAEYGLGMHTAFLHRCAELRDLVTDVLKGPDVPADFRRAFEEWIAAYLDGDKSLGLSNKINDLFNTLPTPDFLAPIKARRDLFVKPSLWIVGGDSSVNDIEFTGLDHVLATGADVNLLVYDNESDANTGFQRSKATPRGAVLKFAAVGKDKPKKGLSEMMMQYLGVYIANYAIGADAKQTITAMKQAETHHGSALLNCYCSCIRHGITPRMNRGHDQAKLAVKSGYWPLFRRDPSATPKLIIDSKPWNSEALKQMLSNEVRYASLGRIDKDRFNVLHSLLAKSNTIKKSTIIQSSVGIETTINHEKSIDLHISNFGFEISITFFDSSGLTQSIRLFLESSSFPPSISLLLSNLMKSSNLFQSRRYEWSLNYEGN
jgi:pyruvate-ferredoxin/flavodoxin oxidoreductase